MFCWVKRGCYPWWPAYTPNSDNVPKISGEKRNDSQTVYIFGFGNYTYVNKILPWDNKVKYNTDIYTDKYILYIIFIYRSLKDAADYESKFQSDGILFINLASIKHQLTSYPTVQCRNKECHMPLFKLSQYCSFDCMIEDVDRKIQGLYNVYFILI